MAIRRRQREARAAEVAAREAATSALTQVRGQTPLHRAIRHDCMRLVALTAGQADWGKLRSVAAQLGSMVASLQQRSETGGGGGGGGRMEGSTKRPPHLPLPPTPTPNSRGNRPSSPLPFTNTGTDTDMGDVAGGSSGISLSGSSRFARSESFPPRRLSALSCLLNASAQQFGSDGNNGGGGGGGEGAHNHRRPDDEDEDYDIEVEIGPGGDIYGSQKLLNRSLESNNSSGSSFSGGSFSGGSLSSSAAAGGRMNGGGSPGALGAPLPPPPPPPPQLVTHGSELSQLLLTTAIGGRAVDPGTPPLPPLSIAGGGGGGGIVDADEEDGDIYLDGDGGTSGEFEPAALNPTMEDSLTECVREWDMMMAPAIQAYYNGGAGGSGHGGNNALPPFKAAAEALDAAMVAMLGEADEEEGRVPYR